MNFQKYKLDQICINGACPTKKEMQTLYIQPRELIKFDQNLINNSIYNDQKN
jgi:hypothetical protein